ncbi:putative fructose-2,6-bisphosphatase TIGAR A [Chanos chanos]|uniref:fructose-2,6-bisphosphate 2-phosphatase n=1 Tax=Chanos chanos TaxID=29144 RepID=A0A6J2WLY1_CHACN|nr:probable fructose-2,6-bisphosphatase TIGAR A [Chanos chanos]
MLSFGLTIIRHGETVYNKDGLLQGQSIDSPLSETGMRQAEAAGQYLKDVKFTNVFVSDMNRAKQTAEIILKNNRTCCGISMDINPALKERSFGIAEGGRMEDMRTMAKAAGQSMLEFTPPEGETMEQVKLRIGQFLKDMFRRILDDHRGKAQPDSGAAAPDADELPEGDPDDGVQNIPAHALVVGHGAYMRVAVRYFVEDLHCSLPQGSDMTHVFSACPNTGMCRFIVTLSCSEENHPLSAIRCVFINRKDHLNCVER